jgi:hypothetical protein
MRFDSGAIFHTVSKKPRCAFESKLAKCCPSRTCTRIGCRSGSVKGGADHFTVPLAGLLSACEAPIAPDRAGGKRVAVLERAALEAPEVPGQVGACGCPSTGSTAKPPPRKVGARAAHRAPML